MTAASYTSDVLQMFYGPITEEANRNLPQPLQSEVEARPRYIDFEIVRNNFNGWLRVWKMRVPPDYVFNADLLVFANKTKSRFVNLLEDEIEQLGAVKAQFA